NLKRFGETVFGDRAPIAWVYDPVRGYERAIRAAEARADGGRPASEGGWYLVGSYSGRDLAFAALGSDPDWAVPNTTPEHIAEVISRYRMSPCHFLRDIFGNPFRPVAFDPEWRTSTVMSLAHQMYESRDFSTMPILADALQDAGCYNADILNHCRATPATHVRGCWVVDMILGKS
ncbi:MAG: hypothetical protein U0792_25500, partial [Gemmataceae bacterium]